MLAICKRKVIGLFAVMLALTGCGGGGGGGDGASNGSPSATGEIVMVTGTGTATGSAVTQSIDATGGTVVEPGTGTSVKVAAGAFSTATDVTMQPVSDTLPFGIGDGVIVTTAQAPTTPLIVTMSYGADVTHPSQLGLAVQADDGSWKSLEPVGIDPTAKTIAAALPAPMVTATGARATMGKIAAAVTVHPGQTIVRYLRFYMKPDKATVHIGKTVPDLTPYVRQSVATCPPQPPCAPNPGGPLPYDCDLLVPPVCNVTPVIKDLPFTNDKPGFTRKWYVDFTEGGSATLGTVASNTPAGATFAAPATKPDPNTVEVMFSSEGSVQPGIVFISADVMITDGYIVKGDFTSTQFPICAYMVADVSDHFEVGVRPDPNNPGFDYIQDFGNENSVLANKQQDPNFDGTATGDDAFEMFTATGGQVTLGGVGNELFVEVTGTSTSSSCTGTPPFGPAVTVPSITEPSTILVDFFADAFQNGKQTLPPQPIPNSSGVWNLTVEEQ